MTSKNGFHNISGQNSGLSKLISCLTLTGCNFGPDWLTHHQVAPLFFFYSVIQNDAFLKKWLR